MQNFLKNVKLTGLTGLAALTMTFNPLSSSAQSSETSELKSARQGDAYFLGGSGTASPGSDARYYFRLGMRERIMENIWAGVEYLNEGHPKEVGHRDGFAVPLWYFIPIGKENKFRIEMGGGPYFSMNTVTYEDNPDKEYNEKNLGMLLSLGASYRLTSKTKAIVQANEILMSGFNSFAITAGLGLDLDEASYEKRFSKEKEKIYSLSFLGGPSVTTRGDAEPSLGCKFQLRRKIPEISKRLALSIAGISEGDSGLSSRKGIAGQVWFITPKISWLELSAGAGSYLTREDNPKIKGNELLAIVSIDARFILTDTLYFEGMFDRVVSKEHVDQDLFLLGGGIKF